MSNFEAFLLEHKLWNWEECRYFCLHFCSSLFTHFKFILCLGKFQWISNYRHFSSLHRPCGLWPYNSWNTFGCEHLLWPYFMATSFLEKHFTEKIIFKWYKIHTIFVFKRNRTLLLSNCDDSSKTSFIYLVSVFTKVPVPRHGCASDKYIFIYILYNLWYQRH